MFSGSADDSLRILIHFGIVVLFQSVFLLRFHESATDRDRIQFIRSDAPVQNFFATNLHIEHPFSLLLYNRNRKREFIVTDRNDGAVWIFWIHSDGILFLRLGGKRDGFVFI